MNRLETWATVHFMSGPGAAVGTLLHLGLALAVTTHVLLYKRDVPAAIAWIGLAWLSPILGPALYWMFGINRVRRRAYRISRRYVARRGPPPPIGAIRSEKYAALERAVGVLTRRPTLASNAIAPMRNGDEAYPVMLQAIAEAKVSIGLASYIFLADEAGRPFIDALIAAKNRGVEVRVMVDGIGSGYFFSKTAFLLRRGGVRVARFMHAWLPWRTAFLNLRNHKKILVVDGRRGFIGGLNISAHNLKAADPRTAVRDMHFEVTGPVVAQIAEAFVTDWEFATGEELMGEAWFPAPEECGSALARVITSGPDQDIEKIEFMFLQAIGSAQRQIKIITPYFLPDERLIAALELAAMRGVDVDIVIPENSDHLVMDWAVMAHIAPLLIAGVKVWRAPQPFEHSKLMTIDGGWSLVGSANWDQRSLRLNFELNMEVYDPDFTAVIAEKIAARQGEEITLRSIYSLPTLIRLRNRAVRLLLPYL
ncbi:MAG TPA: phospholipase D-like domain-containing protein [Dongiaceae bacterium]|jgi:cardiolipin synthase|nr:phospholipase D-like domain-containing protein [Dongiaceae bacterium]